MPMIPDVKVNKPTQFQRQMKNLNHGLSQTMQNE